MKDKKEQQSTVAQRRRMAAQRYAQSIEENAKVQENAAEQEENGGRIKKRPLMSKKKKTVIIISVVSVLLITLIVAGVCIKSFFDREMFGGYDETTHGKVELDEEMTGVYTCLLVATDKSKSNTDTIMLAVLRYDDVKRVDLISIPRDTRVMNPSGNGGHVKINSIMARNGGKINALVTEVRNITGIPINDFMLVDIEAVKKSVDMFGGVMFDVPMDMHYEDGWQDLYIHLDKGMQLIDGDKAEQLLRYRCGYADADLGRTKVQREFMVEAFKQHAKASNLSKIGKWYSEMGGYIQTQITYEKAYKYATIITSDEFEINSQILPGTTISGSPDYFYNAEKINIMAQELGFADAGVVSTPHPSVNVNSGSDFGSDEGPASTILEEIPVETVIPTAPGSANANTRPTSSQGTADDSPTHTGKPGGTSEQTTTPNASGKPSDDDDDRNTLSPTPDSDSEGKHDTDPTSTPVTVPTPDADDNTTTVTQPDTDSSSESEYPDGL